MKKPLLVITGPTAAGKTDVSLIVAEKLRGEIVSADSMQVYRYMNIGTAKPTTAEMKRVRHHMIDIVDPWQEFSVAEYQRLAKERIEDIQNRGRLPVVVGGTGLYINSLVYNLDFADTVSDQKFRNYLTRISEERGKEYLFEMLKRVDPGTAQRLHINDVRRVIRALEVYHCSGRPMSARRNIAASNLPYNLIMFGLRMDRERLYERIEGRVDKMIENGLVEEVEGLLEMGCTGDMVSMQGLGYKEIIGYLEGRLTLSEAIDILKRDTRRFAKRQFTWFKRDDRIIWKDVDIIGDREKIASTMIGHIKLSLEV
ncbi:MAG: tRNA (adenosine(37)-N6)-dimethylallyltransferase MiaA [Bacillota bacterium]